MIAPDKAAEDKTQMLFSTFFNKKASAVRPTSLNWKNLVKCLSHRSVRKEKDGRMFAPAIFEGKRSNATFIAASGLCLDFDHGQPDVAKVLEMFPDTVAAYYSTHSHTPEAPHFRVVLPLSRPVDAEEHFQLVRGIKSMLPLELMECLDASCFDRARAHYLPSCPPDQKHHAFTGHRDGDPLDVERFMRMGAAVGTGEATAQIKQVPALLRIYEYIDHSTGEVVNLTHWAARNPAFDIVAAVGDQYRRGNIKDGKQHIRCPFEDQHTDQDVDTATFVANASPEYPGWVAHCCHAHCVDRDRLEYLLAMLEGGWIGVGQLRTAQTEPQPTPETKRPPYVNYRAQEFVAELVRQPLDPEEFRIHLHLMHAACAVHDGTLPDDSWIIARILGIPEGQWLERFRPLFIRSGWLIAEGGRIFNPTTKREYRAAQDALMRKIAGGIAGGLIAQANRRDREAPGKDT